MALEEILNTGCNLKYRIPPFSKSWIRPLHNLILHLYSIVECNVTIMNDYVLIVIVYSAMLPRGYSDCDQFTIGLPKG